VSLGWRVRGKAGRAAQQAHAADRLIEVSIVAVLVCEGVLSNFIRRITRRRLMRGPLCGHVAVGR
jgi:hypothetical protein